MKLPFILKKPIITERSLKATNSSRFTFEVVRSATKGQIKKAVEEYFKVNVINVNTAKLAGSRRRVGRLRREKTNPDRKKAIVQLKSGQKIDLFEAQK